MVNVPESALRVEVDDPQSRRLAKAAGIIRGWFASRNEEIGEGFHFQIAGSDLPHRIERRQDVEGALPECTIVGFTIQYDLSDYLPHIQNNRLAIRLVVPSYEPHLLRFTIEERALATCLAAASGL